MQVFIENLNEYQVLLNLIFFILVLPAFKYFRNQNILIKGLIESNKKNKAEIEMLIDESNTLKNIVFKTLTPNEIRENISLFIKEH